MSDYKELVKALRCCCPQPEETCDGCPYDTAGECNISRMMLDAAAAIEALQAEVESMDESCKKQLVAMASHVAELQAEVKRLKMHCADCEYGNSPWPEEPGHEPKRGEWELIDGAEPMRWGCSRCKYLSWETSNYCPRCGAKMEVQE